MEISALDLAKAVKLLKDADGEDIGDLLRALHMEEQMLRQLFLTAPIEQIDHLIDERDYLESQK